MVAGYRFPVTGQTIGEPDYKQRARSAGPGNW